MVPDLKFKMPLWLVSSHLPYNGKKYLCCLWKKWHKCFLRIGQCTTIERSSYQLCLHWYIFYNYASPLRSSLERRNCYNLFMVVVGDPGSNPAWRCFSFRVKNRIKNCFSGLLRDGGLSWSHIVCFNTW